MSSQSIRFRAQSGVPGDVPVLSLGADTLSLSPVLVTPTYTVYGADVTPYQGQEVELRFTAPVAGRLAGRLIERAGHGG